MNDNALRAYRDSSDETLGGVPPIAPVTRAHGTTGSSTEAGEGSSFWVSSLVGGGVTDAEPEQHKGRIHAPFWADTTALEGMGLAVQRVRALARDLYNRVDFAAPEVAVVSDGPHGETSEIVVLTIRLPGDVDAEGFQDELFGRLVDELTPADRIRLAVRVV
jgi:hypothetical protein